MQPEIKLPHEKPRNSFGQSAMEFLMTYGWALLIIVIIIAVLFYLGILQPKTPNSLIFSPGFSASSFRVGSETGAFELDFGYAKGQTIRVTKAGCSMQEIPALTQSLTNLTNPVVIPSGTHKWIIGGDSGNTLNCLDENGNQLDPSNAEVGQRYRGKVCIEYEEVESGLTRQVCGDLNARFESGVSGATPTPTPSPITEPTTISSPGYYVLQNDLNSNDTCITITSGGSNSTLDCNGRTITGSGSGYGIYLNSTTGVTIKNCIVRNFSFGIYLDSSSNNTLTSNTANSNTQHGILIEFSSNNNTLTSNTASSNTYGIELYSSSNNNTITSNNASSNTYGIFLHSSLYNIVISNTANSNSIGILLFRISTNNTIASNTVRLNRQHGIVLDDYSNNNLLDDNIACNNNQSGGSYYDLYCNNVAISSGDSIFDTNSGCNVTQTSTCS